MTLEVRGGGDRYAVRLVDDAASVCLGAPASVSGAGVAEGSVLWARVTLACLPGGNIFRGRIEISFTHSATDDTLTDNEGIVWSRAA